MSKYSMFGDLWMTFEKNGNGNIKFNDKGLGDAISNANLDAILGETGSSDDIIGNVDFASLLKEETKFKWEFINKKNYLRFNIYDASADSYSSNIDMKILSLCKSDCKLRYEENSTKVEISMQK
jgi:2C-methyl-D-erythritol 2,4-cyclodiphosphate synthase